MERERGVLQIDLTLKILFKMYTKLNQKALKAKEKQNLTINLFLIWMLSDQLQALFKSEIKGVTKEI